MTIKNCKENHFGILLNVSPELAERATRAAKACGESRNAFTRRALEAAVRGVLKAEKGARK
jgi:predicted HicB family RNase H-like nuclease